MKNRLFLSLVVAATIASQPAFGGPDHTGFITGSAKTGSDLTKICLSCHKKQASDLMKTAHWNWAKEQTVKGEVKTVGIRNVIGNFYPSITPNLPACTSCHAGFGWSDASFDFSKQVNVDCVVCHESTGSYRKFPTGAGHPVYEGEVREFPPGTPWPPVDLLRIARSVGKPTRANCGTCHFNGGGGDHVKHADLDSSLISPSRETDVHMGRGMVCQTCHKTTSHAIPGESLLVSGGDGQRVLCADCHTVKPHKNPVMNIHAKRVACQTCHIPTVARELPTKVWWDWSKAGQDLPDAGKDRFGQETYGKKTGEARWDKAIVPTYYWYNGTVDRLLPGDRLDPAGVVQINSPVGSRTDPKSLITPFKVMRGKQPYDKANNYLVYLSLVGPDGYWNKFDWNLAIAEGMKAAGLPYSGQYGFVETSTVWKVNHMVAPKAQTLKCPDCHGETGRLDWKALGYGSDPRKKR
jgi:octaheme c-type cytochrome (tetrathionate reductase family)